MDANRSEYSSPTKHRWRKGAYGGMQPGYDDNYTEESFPEDMVMTANVVKKEFSKGDARFGFYLSVSVHPVYSWCGLDMHDSLDENSLLLINASLLASGFLVLFVTKEISLGLLFHYLLNIIFFITCQNILAPFYKTLTISISSNSIWVVTVSLLIIHLFLHDYSQSDIRAPGTWKSPSLTSCISLNASIVASVFIASRLAPWRNVFAIMLFSPLVFLFAPFVTYCIKRYSFRLHLLCSFVLTVVSLGFVYMLHRLLFIGLLGSMVFVTVVYPFWLIMIQEYKFEINGPGDEAKLCFDIAN